MGFRYQIRDADGDDLGEAEYATAINVGDTIHLDGASRARVVAVVPIERVQEHISRPLYGLLQVQKTQ